MNAQLSAYKIAALKLLRIAKGESEAYEWSTSGSGRLLNRLQPAVDPGAVFKHAGALWVAIEPTCRTPSRAHDEWLMVDADDFATLAAMDARHEGHHETGKSYRKGAFVTHQGSVWHANYTTATAPGDGQAWTLAYKRGRDAR